MENSTTVGSTGIEQQEPTTENLFGWNSIRLPQDYQLASGVKKVILRIPVETPNRHEFVRVHPTLSFQAWVLEDK